MKVKNWRKNLVAALIAAGFMVPCTATAAIITVPDADFNKYDIVRAQNYAYAHSAGSYRPTSPWVDDYGNVGQDTGNGAGGGNWIYNSQYANDHAIYPYPHGAGADDQVMVGSGHFAGQTLQDATYQADTTYIYSLWAQGLGGATQAPSSSSQRAFMYLFDGDNPATLNDTDAVARGGFRADQGNFNSRDSNGTGNANSQANWTQLSINYMVPTGSPLIGHHIGVGFYLYKFTSIDDVSLTASTVPEPATVVLLGLGGVALLCGGRWRDSRK